MEPGLKIFYLGSWGLRGQNSRVPMDINDKKVNKKWEISKEIVRKKCEKSKEKVAKK